jgi:DNA anti-recombination protein RmuC
MSRSYRICVRESVSRVIHADDRVSTHLEILEVLPPEEMAGLLADELERRGFQRQDDGTLVRRTKGAVVTVEPATATVTAAVETAEAVKVEDAKEGRAFDDAGQHAERVKQSLRQELRRDLEKQVGEKETALRTQVADELEARLGSLREELDQTVNRVTAEALKRKAARLGRIKEISEDSQAGSLTIVVEV